MANVTSTKCTDFFKVYIPKYSIERMLIPHDFIRELNVLIPEKVIFRTRTGNLWYVRVSKTEDGVFFQKGWQGFVRDNSLERGEFLVFRYHGACIFDIKILGHSGCEKERREQLEREREEEEEEEVKEEEQYEDEEEDADDDSASDGDGVEEMEEEEEKGSEEELEVEISNKKRRWKKIDKNNGGYKGKAPAKVEGEKGTGANKVEDDGELKAESYLGDPKNPYFVTKLRKSRKMSLFIPTDVIKDYNLKLLGNLSFRDPFGSRDGKVDIWKDGRVWIKGWGSICRRNKLGPDDRIICEFLQGRDEIVHAIKVHIVRSG